MKTTHYLLIAVASCTLILGACSSDKEPTFGERIQGESLEMKSVGKQWTKGNNLLEDGKSLVASGNKDIDKSAKLLKKGENKVKKGQTMIKKGERLKNESETIYNQSKAPAEYGQF